MARLPALRIGGAANKKFCHIGKWSRAVTYFPLKNLVIYATWLAQFQHYEHYNNEKQPSWSLTIYIGLFKIF
jgi:hypothetical protein